MMNNVWTICCGQNCDGTVSFIVRFEIDGNVYGAHWRGVEGKRQYAKLTQMNDYPHTILFEESKDGTKGEIGKDLYVAMEKAFEIAMNSGDVEF